jgi:hypothetical protein
MALKKIVLLIAFVGLVVPVFTQAVDDGVLTYQFNVIKSDMAYLANLRERYKKIDGTPYLDEEFRKGSLSLGSSRISNIDLRYNIYEGHFEFMDEDIVKFIDPRRNQVDTVWLDGDTYMYVSFEAGKHIKMTYMKLVWGDGTRVLLNHKMMLTEPEETQGYKEAQPARFSRQQDLIFIQPTGSHAMEFKGKKSLEEVFPEHHHQLSAYAKKEKLKLKKPEDIVKLCSYYDSVKNNQQ